MTELTVVTGGTGGLGPAVLEAVGGFGGVVVGVAAPRHDLSRLARELAAGVAWERCDLRDEGEVAALFARLDRRGQVARLVNVAGGYRGGRLVDSAPEDLGDMLALNLQTAWWTCRAAAPRMAAAGSGAIVNVAAQAGVEFGGGAAAYSVSKAAVVALTRVLAAELEGHGVRVSAVAPRLIDTPANRATIPVATMARATSPEHIAGVIRGLLEVPGESGAVVPV